MSKEKEKTTESVVKENLTSEQRAREYVLNINFSNSTGVYIENEIKGIAYQSYIDSYHSRDEEVKELREALKEITNALQERCDKYGMSPIEYEVLAKAK